MFTQVPAATSHFAAVSHVYKRGDFANPVLVGEIHICFDINGSHPISLTSETNDR